MLALSPSSRCNVNNLLNWPRFPPVFHTFVISKSASFYQVFPQGLGFRRILQRFPSCFPGKNWVSLASTGFGLVLCLWCFFRKWCCKRLRTLMVPSFFTLSQHAGKHTAFLLPKMQSCQLGKCDGLPYVCLWRKSSLKMLLSASNSQLYCLVSFTECRITQKFAGLKSNKFSVVLKKMHINFHVDVGLQQVSESEIAESACSLNFFLFCLFFLACFV